jgi:hypothetical protein
MTKLRKARGDADGGPLLMFNCPGCKHSHGLRVGWHPKEPVWDWNGSMESPTLTPAILCNANDPRLRCHSLVKGGKIQFLDDCFHSLAGQTVDLPDWD